MCLLEGRWDLHGHIRVLLRRDLARQPPALWLLTLGLRLLDVALRAARLPCPDELPPSPLSDMPPTSSPPDLFPTWQAGPIQQSTETGSTIVHCAIDSKFDHCATCDRSSRTAAQRTALVRRRPARDPCCRPAGSVIGDHHLHP
jgi:hypothetical protein